MTHDIHDESPILGDRMTGEQRADCLATLEAAIRTIANNAGQDLAEHMHAAANKLTNSELLQITHGAAKPIRGARILLLALAAERIERQWSAESTKLDVKRVRRWLRNRP